nr:hypothetical protein [Dubosiella newyorkensis]
MPNSIMSMICSLVWSVGPNVPKILIDLVMLDLDMQFIELLDRKSVV